MANLQEYLHRYLEQDSKSGNKQKKKSETDEAKNSEIAKLKFSELEKLLKRQADNKIAGDGGEDTRKIVSPNPVQGTDSTSTKQSVAKDEGSIKKLTKELKDLGYGKQITELRKKCGVGGK
jgi:hypothetical protein